MAFRQRSSKTMPEILQFAGNFFMCSFALVWPALLLLCGLLSSKMHDWMVGMTLCLTQIDQEALVSLRP